MTFPIFLFLKSAVVTNEIAEKNVQWSLSANSTFEQKYVKFKWGEVLEILESIKKHLFTPLHFEAFCCILGKKVQSMPIIMCFVIKIHQFSNVSIHIFLWSHKIQPGTEQFKFFFIKNISQTMTNRQSHFFATVFQYLVLNK